MPALSAGDQYRGADGQRLDARESASGTAKREARRLAEGQEARQTEARCPALEPLINRSICPDNPIIDWF